jgi:hypothetical protein
MVMGRPFRLKEITTHSALTLDAQPQVAHSAPFGREKNFFETRVIEYQTGGGLEW